jgi:hypothetical protein
MASRFRYACAAEVACSIVYRIGWVPSLFLDLCLGILQQPPRALSVYHSYYAYRKSQLPYGQGRASTIDGNAGF